MLAHVIVSGRVQGVGFRYSTQQQAQNNQLTGWVRNKADGSVELEVEGDETRVDIFLDELRKGFSPFIHVEDIKVTKQDKTKGFNSFMIK